MNDLVAEIDRIITDGIDRQPRSLQRRIGPSEMGAPCDRRIGYKIAGQSTVNASDRVAWKPWIGTQAHEGLACLFEVANGDADAKRFLTEWKLEICRIGGETITGTCDLYVDGVVVDWKTVGADQMRKYRREGPGRQYRTQAHLYGYGWARLGYPVHTVAVYFLPRDQEFRQRHFWSEPYDPAIAESAIARVDGIAKLVSALGKSAFPMLKTGDSYCRYCPWYRQGSTDPTEACAGHPGAAQTQNNSLASLIA